MSIEEKRRWLFEAWADDQGYDLTRNNIVAYEAGATRCAWAGFNAALDAVVIELPRQYEIGGLAGDAHDRAVAMCRNAIEAAGVKVK